MRSVPDAEDFLKVNTLDNVLDEYGSVYITHQNRILYYEKTDQYLNFALTNYYGDQKQDIIGVNGIRFVAADDDFYLNYIFGEKRSGPNAGWDPYAGFERMMNTIGDKYTVKRKKGQYVMSFELRSCYKDM